MVVRKNDAQSGEMRIARALSLLGYCSRREAERLIAQRRVSVDGRVVESPATLVDPSRQEVRVDRKEIERSSTKRVYLAVHKPAGVTSTLRDPHAERTIAELAPGMGRLYPVGRLDKDSEGLILLTNDGDFANRVAHPRYGVTREYLAQVDALPGPEALRRLRHGVMLDGRRATPSLVEAAPRGQMPTSPGSRSRGDWVRIVLREGRNREVRRILAVVGCTVLRLVRTRVGPVRLSGLRPGQYRPLKPREIETLMRWSERAHTPEQILEEDIVWLDDGPLTDVDVPTTLAEAGSEPVLGRRDHLVVAIDGPAAAGKTTVGKALAQDLGAVFLDTGVLYRVLTLEALERGIDVTDGARLADLAEHLDVRIGDEGKAPWSGEPILVGERDVTEQIRSDTVNGSVSLVAAHPEVRNALVSAQRRAAKAPAAVVVGRDIGTVIFPDADVKIFLDASPEERGRRRAQELSAEARQAEVQAQIAERDEIDRNRAVAPLEPAPDAWHIDTDGLGVHEVADLVRDIVQRHQSAT
jgi:cytidylate kinase